MKAFIKGWWHVLTATLAAVWLCFGWVQDVNAALDTVTVLEETTVRKDVLNETMLRIELQLRKLNANWERHYKESAP